VIKPGDIIDYYYLWHRQAEAGEESGRKARPVCLAVVSQRDPTRLFLFPVTTQPPFRDRAAFALSQLECKRVRLRHPSWLILDEYNIAATDYVTDFGDLEPRGSLTPATLRAVLGEIRALQAAGRLRGVRRDTDSP